MPNNKEQWRFITNDPSRQEWYHNINQQGDVARDRHQELMDEIENQRRRRRDNRMHHNQVYYPQHNHIWDEWVNEEDHQIHEPHRPRALRLREMLGRNNRERRVEEREREIRRREQLVEQRESALRRRERAARDELHSHEELLRQTVKLLGKKSSAEAEPERVIFSSDKTHCAICTESYEAGAKLSLTPCKHMFHEECLGKWKETKPECPLCQKKL